MKLNNYLRFIPFLAVFTLSCVKYSPYEVIIDAEDTDQTAKNIERLNQMDQSEDTITFAFIGDTQRFYDKSVDFVTAINARSDVEFVIISGDLTEFGLNDEFNAMSYILNQLDVPFLTVIGNHDLIYNGQKVYEEMFGPLDYIFFFKRMKFVMINTNSREFEFNGHVPNIPWLTLHLADTNNYTNAVVIGHVPPGNDDFDPALEIPYANALGSTGRTLLSMNGHNHDFGVDQPYKDGVTYLNSFSIGKGKYLIVQLWPDGFSFKVKSL